MYVCMYIHISVFMNIVRWICCPPSRLHSASFATPLSPSVVCRAFTGGTHTPVVLCCVLVYTPEPTVRRLRVPDGRRRARVAHAPKAPNDEARVFAKSGHPPRPAQHLQDNPAGRIRVATPHGLPVLYCAVGSSMGVWIILCVLYYIVNQNNKCHQLHLNIKCHEQNDSRKIDFRTVVNVCRRFMI